MPPAIRICVRHQAPRRDKIVCRAAGSWSLCVGAAACPAPTRKIDSPYHPSSGRNCDSGHLPPGEGIPQKGRHTSTPSNRTPPQSQAMARDSSPYTGEPFATPLLRIKFAAPTLPRRGISAFHFSLFPLLFSLKRTPRKIQGVRFSCHSIQTVVSTGSPWTYLWSQSSSKSRERRSMGHPRARSSARIRNSGAGSRHSR